MRSPRSDVVVWKLTAFPCCILLAVEKKFPGDREKLARMSLIEGELPLFRLNERLILTFSSSAEGYPQQVRMANLAVIGASPSISILNEFHRRILAHYFGCR